MKHLDEGTIHAWLDGALGAEDAAEVERHAAMCDECAARVAEARGLIAGASRILSALDDVGSEIVPARVPEVTRKRRRPNVTRVVAWMAAAGLLLAVGLETRARTGPESMQIRGVYTGQAPAGIADSLIDSIQVIKGAPASTYGVSTGNPAINVTVPKGDSRAVGRSDSQRVGQSDSRTVGQRKTRETAAKTAPGEATKPVKAVPVAPAAAAASGVAGGMARPSVTSNMAAMPDSTARAARARAAAEGLKMQDVVVTGVAEPQDASAVPERVPMCFAEAAMAPAMAPVPADAARGAAKAAAGTMRTGVSAAAPTSAGQLRAQLAPNVLMLDSTPVSPNATGAQEPRLLFNADGVAGEWQRLDAKGTTGSDSVVLRFVRPAGRVVRAELTPEGLKADGRVMVRVRCG